jgi:hypothetical protein
MKYTMIIIHTITTSHPTFFFELLFVSVLFCTHERILLFRPTLTTITKNIPIQLTQYKN